MGKPGNETISTSGGVIQEEWLRDGSEHPYKFEPTKAKWNTVAFPAITKCNTYIMRHYAANIVEDIEQSMYDGDLADFFGIPDFIEDCMALRDCRISPRMSFWWKDRYSFLADIPTSACWSISRMPMCSASARPQIAGTSAISVASSIPVPMSIP